MLWYLYLGAETAKRQNALMLDKHVTYKSQVQMKTHCDSRKLEAPFTTYYTITYWSNPQMKPWNKRPLLHQRL
jgi:hypothetical protein